MENGFNSVQDSVQQSSDQWKMVGFNSVQNSVQASVQLKMVGFDKYKTGQNSRKWLYLI